MILADIKFDTNQLIKEYKPVIFDKNKFKALRYLINF